MKSFLAFSSICALVVILGGLSLSAQEESACPENYTCEFVSVVRIVDGDTFDIKREDFSLERIRAQVWDTLEIGGTGKQPDCLSVEATDYLTNLILGRGVWIVHQGIRIQGNRLLAHTYLDLDRQALLGAIMISQGFARIHENATPSYEEERLRSLAAQAESRGDGIWSCPTTQ